MKKTKVMSAKRSFFMSVLSLILCFAMLLGTTWAWFTDEVTSGVNQIKAGNLDIEVEYSKTGEANSWANLQDSPSLFTDVLWEPGHTEVVYLKVENKGTLALRYKYAVNAIAETIGTTKAGGKIKLSDILKFGIVKTDDFQSYTRDSARAAVDVDENVLALNTYTNDIHMAKGGKAYFAMLVYMPEEVGNEANYLTGTTPPSIDLGINVVATQDTVETDSFNHNYDVNAYQAAGYTVTAVVPVETVSKAIPTTVAGGNETVRADTTIVAGGITVTYPSGALMNNSSTKAAGDSSEDAKQGLVPKDTEPEHSVSVPEDETAKTYELTLPVSKDNNVLVKFVKNIGADKTITNVYHNGNALLHAESTTPESDGVKEYYDYSSATGDLTLWVYHASEITTTEKDSAPVEHMFPDVNVTIMSEVAAGSEIVMTDAASGTKAIIPGSAIDEGIVKVGQKIYVVIITTKKGENSATYDISVRDADGKPFSWTLNCMPEVTFFLGKQNDLTYPDVFNFNLVEAGWINLFDGVGASKYPKEIYNDTLYDEAYDSSQKIYRYGYLKYGLPTGDGYRPGVVYNPETGFITIRSLTFE